jgi:hypothetical protein
MEEVEKMMARKRVRTLVAARSGVGMEMLVIASGRGRWERSSLRDILGVVRGK